MSAERSQEEEAAAVVVAAGGHGGDATEVRCVLCSTTFDHPDHLALHYVRIHLYRDVASRIPQQQQPRDWCCPVCCERGFVDRHHVIIHVGMKHHLQPTEPIPCRMCGSVFDCKSLLAAHVIQKHTDWLGPALPSVAPFRCPLCSVSEATFLLLVAHWMCQHAVAKNGTSSSAGQTAKGFKRRSNESSQKAKTFEDFSQQVRRHLRTKDGCCAEAVDERSVKCVCGKIIRLHGTFHWRYLIQKPVTHQGQVFHKGHWFLCSAVTAKGSDLPEHLLNESDDDDMDEDVEDHENEEQVSASKRRRTKKPRNGSFRAMPMMDVDKDQGTGDGRLLLDEDSDASMGSDQGDEQLSEADAKMAVRKWVCKKLAERVPGQEFLQDGPCFMMADNMVMCHECKFTPISTRYAIMSKGNNGRVDADASCCFYGFRKLRYTKGGYVAVAGYLDPFKDPTDDKGDLALWKVNPSSPPHTEVTKAKMILSLIGDQFCDMVQQESKCLSLYQRSQQTSGSSTLPLAWKPAVTGVRELCDVCRTTIFNHHWICSKCGIAVCLDCYQARLDALSDEEDSKEVSHHTNWPCCNNGEAHILPKLLMTQIIPKDALLDMALQMHHIRHKLQINQFCHSRPQEFVKLFMKHGSSNSTLVSESSTSSVAAAATTTAVKPLTCHLCNEEAFKNQAEVHKHLVFIHLKEYLGDELAQKPPYNCHRCDYVATSPSFLLMHYGIKHKLVANLQAKKAISMNQQPQQQAPKSICAVPSSFVCAFQCPICSLTVSHNQSSDHLCKHFHDLLSADLPSSIPFSCPRYNCHFVALDRPTLIRHYGSFHGLANQYFKEFLKRRGQDHSRIVVHDKLQDQKVMKNESGVRCRLCEICPVLLKHQDDLCRHLSETHFSERLLVELQNVPIDTKPFKCNQAGCQFSTMTRCLLLPHLGLVHKFALTFYRQALGLASEASPIAGDNSQEVHSITISSSPANFSNSRTGTKNATVLCPICEEEIAEREGDVTVHLADKHFESELAAAGVVKQPPYKCPLCPHFSQDRQAYLKHFLVFHQMLNTFLTKYSASSNKMPFVPGSAVVTKLEHHHPERDQDAGAMSNRCLLCDEVPLVLDLPKHLAEEHYGDKLRHIISHGHNTCSPKSPIRCPFAGCDYQHTAKWNVALHYGVEHDMVQRWYSEVIGSDPPFIQGSKDRDEQSCMNGDHKEVQQQEPGLHKMLDQERVKGGNNDDDEEMVDLDQTTASIEDNGHQPDGTCSSVQSSTLSSSNQQQDYDCQVCAVKSKGQREYLQHLSKVHFRQKLLSCVPEQAPFHCPVDGCSVVKKDRLSIAVHYGTSHRVALTYVKETPLGDLHDDEEAVCKLCNQSFTAQRYLFTHLSDSHFSAELDASLPLSAPWKCPKCVYLGSDKKALRIHFGVKHKFVLGHLATSLGMDVSVLKREIASASRKKVQNSQKAAIECPFCPVQFKESEEQAKHVAMHLQNELSKQLDTDNKCPRCEFQSPLRMSLIIHYGSAHADVIEELLKRPRDSLDLTNLADQQQKGKLKKSVPGQSRPPDEDKRFPKCRLCNYRYFTRLDLCRHFIDFHLRERLASCIEADNDQCPCCTLTYEKQQSRLRHFIWSHQDLERLVVQEFQVRLSEFTPSSRDLEMVQIKRFGGKGGEEEVRDITDLASLPVHECIDSKLNIPNCELCGEVFKSSMNRTRDKSSHLLCHFREDIIKDLPRVSPFQCPQCTFVGKDLNELSRHYALSHRVLFTLMQKELGQHWKMAAQLEAYDCLVCGQALASSRSLNEHYCSQHFFQAISALLPSEPPFQCHTCNFQSKSLLSLVRHVGLKHQMVKAILQQQGYASPQKTLGGHTSGLGEDKIDQPPFEPQQPFPTHSAYPDEHSKTEGQAQQQAIDNSVPSSPFAQHPSITDLSQSYQVTVQTDQASSIMFNPVPDGGYPLSTQKSPDAMEAQDSTAKSAGCPKNNDLVQVACPICHSTFLNPTHFLRHAADKHFVDQLKVDLPSEPPFICPFCKFETKDCKLLIRHYGIIHKMVLKFLNERAGIPNSFDDSILKTLETKELNREACPMCNSSFGGRYLLLRHLADCHFRERLCQGMQQEEVYKCPECNHTSKDKGGFVRHYGLVHKMVQKWLKEKGIAGFDEEPVAPKKNKTLPPPPPPPFSMAPTDAVALQQPLDHCEANAVMQYYDSPTNSNANFAQPETPSSTQSFGEQPVLQQAQAQPAFQQYYLSPPYQQQMQFSPLPQTPQFQNSSMTSPASVHQQNSPPVVGHAHDVSASGGYLSPQTPGSVYAPFESYYTHSQDVSRPSHPSSDYSPQTPYYSPNSNNVVIHRSNAAHLQQQPLTPQPMTPGSHGAPTPQPPLTPQDGMVSPAPAPYQQQIYYVPAQTQPHVQVGQQSQIFSQVITRPVTLQPQDAPPNQVRLQPPMDEFIEPPAVEMKAPFAIQCIFCSKIIKNKSDFYRHLTERHFKLELARELPTQPPFKCPVHSCAYETKDNTVAPLIKHYGIVHKAVQKYLQNQIAGRYVHHDKNSVSASVTALSNGLDSSAGQAGLLPVPQQQQQVQTVIQVQPSTLPASAALQQTVQPVQPQLEQVMSNRALKMKCPFCELMFAGPYAFHQHLCDKHFKDTLAQQVPLHPPYKCPVQDCGYLAKDSRQSLIRHFGMKHKVVFELLKRHAPGYELQDHFLTEDSSHQLSSAHQPPEQLHAEPQPQFFQQLVSEPQINTAGFLNQYESHPVNQPIYVTTEILQQHPAQPEAQHHQPAASLLSFEPHMDGAFDQNQFNDHPIEGVPSAVASSVNHINPEMNGQSCASSPATKQTTSSPSQTNGPNICEICGKMFDGKNKAMLKVQHMAHHFKDKLFADLTDVVPPFRCPIQGCTYQTKHKPDWARHYGSVHKFIKKYLDEYLDEKNKSSAQMSTESVSSFDVSDGERTYSAFLPKADLNQIINTALTQQSQPDKNFGVVTINAPSTPAAPIAHVPRDDSDLVDQLIQQTDKFSTVYNDGGSSLNSSVQCFLCQNGPWFKDDKDLSDHISTHHLDLKVATSQLTKMEVDDLEASLLDETPVSLEMALDQISSSATNSMSSLTSIQTKSISPGRSTGRPCEICGFEPKTKNKSRERQDHLAMKHYRERIQQDLASVSNYQCPLCNYVGKDKQTIYRHYTGKHKVVEQYLAEDIDAGNVIPLLPQSQQKLLQENHSLVSAPTSSNALIASNSSGLNVRVHSLADPTKLTMMTDFMDLDGFSGLHEQIMQVDGTVDVDDEEIDENVTCQLCPTSVAKNDLPEHLASTHFKQKLTLLFPQSDHQNGYLCVVCGHRSSLQIDMWLHFVNKHASNWITEAKAASASLSASESGDSCIPQNASFFCDLCQGMVVHQARMHHFAESHFRSRLNQILPANSANMTCPLCKFESKTSLDLDVHFLSQHVHWFDTWFREDMDKLETEHLTNIAANMHSPDVASPEFPKTSSTKHRLDDSDDTTDLKADTLHEAFRGILLNVTGIPKDFLEPLCVIRQNNKRFRCDVSTFDLRDWTKIGSKASSGRSRDYCGLLRQHLPTSQDPIPVRTLVMEESKSIHPDVPHEWICEGKLLVLTDPTHRGNLELFQEQWIRGQPVIVANVCQHLSKDLWRPEAFSRDFGHIEHDIVNTRSGKIIPKVPLKRFWDGFEHLSERMNDELGRPMLLKLKDWPPDNDFAHYLPDRFDDLMKSIPLPDYTKREGRFNLASSVPDFFARPDLGPKMYIAYGNALYPNTGTTNLHIDMSDACNVMVYVSIPQDGNREEHIREGLKCVEEAGCDIVTRIRIRQSEKLVGAIWHIYHPRDANKIRDLLHKVAMEKGTKIQPNTDPIHDQNIFLDATLRKRLYEEYGVIGYAFPQCQGDTVFIPAGAPHQVRNVHNCIKVAEDFVSPENLNWCFYQTEEFRHLSEVHTNHEDKLQIKNILFHAVKDCISVLQYDQKLAVSTPASSNIEHV